MSKNFWSGALAVLLLLTVACERKPSPTPVDESVDPELAEFEEKRLERERKLEAMPVPELARELASDSAQHVEPFNSAAVREVRRRVRDGAKPEEIAAIATELKASLRDPDARSHLGLLALRNVSPDVYRSVDADFRYQVLTDALRSAEFFNAWGVPHLFLTQPAGRAITCEDSGIEKYLYPLLDLDKPTLIWGGSEAGAEHDEYAYRVKDYAWALIYAERGEPVANIPKSPKERDLLIEQTKKEASARNAKSAQSGRVKAAEVVQKPGCET